MTVQRVPTFNLRAVERPVRVDELLEGLNQYVYANDHFELFRMPHADWALAKWDNRTEEPERPRGRCLVTVGYVGISLRVAAGLVAGPGLLEAELEIGRLGVKEPA